MLGENVRLFFDEAAYQLCDGYGINTEYYSIHPNIGGTFNSVNESHNHQKHPIGFRFRVRGKLRRLVECISVDITGLADTNGYIDEFMDIATGIHNETITAGSQFVL